jgi:hypothetical protein
MAQEERDSLRGGEAIMAYGAMVILAVAILMVLGATLMI